MPRQELTQTLQALQLELEKLDFDNQSHKDSVDKSIAQLEHKLRNESFMSGDEFLVEELKESLQQFEQAHPKLVNLVGRIADLLTKIGI